ncbi:transcriptional regulator domain protein [Acinetobacter baumannii 1032359]|nr:transcriptional regulator domain protein [Acinetobacter baumannii 1032359]
MNALRFSGLKSFLLKTQQQQNLRCAKHSLYGFAVPFFLPEKAQAF